MALTYFQGILHSIQYAYVHSCKYLSMIFSWGLVLFGRCFDFVHFGRIFLAWKIPRSPEKSRPWLIVPSVGFGRQRCKRGVLVTHEIIRSLFLLISTVYHVLLCEPLGWNSAHILPLLLSLLASLGNIDRAKSSHEYKYKDERKEEKVGWCHGKIISCVYKFWINLLMHFVMALKKIELVGLKLIAAYV